jgi:thiamine-monophosphate kinase
VTTMTELGEKAFLKSLLPTLEQAKNFVNGFGHDVSVVDVGLSKNIAFKIDRAPHPISVRNHWSDYKVWGRLAVVANVSDLVAAGARPKAFMLSIIAPGATDHQRIKEIVDGCIEGCADHHLSFVGGDTKEGEVLQVVGACIGTSEKQYFLGRAVAQPGDHLVIAGLLGEFLSAYLLLKEGEIDEQVRREELMKVLTHPRAKMEECEYITERRLATASCDLSDGISDALSNFCNDQVGITIDEFALPIHPLATNFAARTSLESHKFAFGVGDWAVAFVVPKKYVGMLKCAEAIGLKFACIGTFDNSGKKLIRRLNGAIEAVPSEMNEQFVARLEDESAYLDTFKTPQR